MIVIQKAQSNTVSLTLNEKTTLENPFYVFKFIKDEIGIAIGFCATDISLHPERYNRFIITEDTVENIFDGQISLENTGFYRYEVYEHTTAGEINFSGNIVETGIVDVRGVSQNIVDIDSATTYEVDENLNILS